MKSVVIFARKPSQPNFRTVLVDELANFKWKDIVADLQLKAPLLFTILHEIAARNDNRNVVKVGAAHYPGICTTTAILLKERSREMWAAVPGFPRHVHLSC